MNELGFAPKHVLIADNIRNRILSGSLSPGKRLRPDTELAKQFSVNKKTVSNGMALLVAEGLISRCPGRGTTVIGRKKNQEITNAVGLAMLSAGDIFANIAGTFTEALINRGAYPILINNSIFSTAVCSANAKILPELIANILDDRPLGMIVDGDESIPFDMLQSHAGRMRNLVFIHHYQATHRIQPAKYVLVDHEEGGRRMAAHFITRGHRRLTFFATKERTRIGYVGSPQQQIMAGFREVCEKEGIIFNSEIPERLMRGEDAQSVVHSCLRGNNAPTAGGTPYDYYACHTVIPALKEAGLTVPREVSVIGFFNTPWSEKCAPALTSLSINEGQMAETAIKMLFDETPECDVVIEPEIVERQSVAVLKE